MDEASRKISRNVSLFLTLDATLVGLSDVCLWQSIISGNVSGSDPRGDSPEVWWKEWVRTTPSEGRHHPVS